MKGIWDIERENRLKTRIASLYRYKNRQKIQLNYIHNFCM